MSDVAFNAQELMKWSGAIFISAIEAYVLYSVAFKKKTWDLSGLLLAEDGVASMARFQLMLFTFAIVGGYFYILLQTGKFPQVDATT
ncbi:MAG TPA: hypothetical protein VN648_13195, partial [Candidatus Methylomirabilis sp.]|nr:hypothetical protein [Candidatus Methylomirabilis sp.]